MSRAGIFDQHFNIRQQEVVPYLSEGEFSMHELLGYLLSVTGPADVKLTSFSITEVAVRTFMNLIESGFIKSLSCIFDLTVKQHKTGLLFFASNITPSIALAKCHAKLILISNDAWKITVVSSANLNINDKTEAGIVATTSALYNFYSPRFDSLFEKSLKINTDDF